jgi:oligoendopeptidase F
MTKPRSEVQKSDQWNVEALYPSINDWKKIFETSSKESGSKFPKIEKFRKRLGESDVVLKETLEAIHAQDREIGKLATYAHLRHDEEIANPDNKEIYSKAMSLANEFQQEIAWFEPELLNLPQTTIDRYLTSPLLKEWRFYLEKVFRLKPHTLPEEQELLLAMSAKALTTPYKAFNAITDADFKFGTVKDSQGAEHELTHGKYSLLLRSNDATLRENCFKSYFGKYQSYGNTLAELLSGQIEGQVFYAKAKKFETSLEASLYPKNIPTSVYHSLIQAVHDKISSLHRYIRVRSKILGIKPLHVYDLQVPLTKNFDLKIPYGKAEELVIASVAPLGKEYQVALKKGLLEDRWVDRFENQNKRSGAYSSGCFDSMPYILMNYKEIIRDLFTLAHEAGHSMHSYYSRKCQPYQYSDYSIFVAEVASTFNEELLLQMMLKEAGTKEERIFLLNQKIDDIRATLFRQTQFAEFELLIHTLTEQKVPLTPERLSEEYLKIHQFYYGEDLAKDPEVAFEWSRIPHFYYNYYVYQYATGISAALALAEKVQKGGEKEREAYLSFLKSGSSLYPIDALKLAGIDMTTSEPVVQAIGRFDRLLDALEKEISS